MKSSKEIDKIEGRIEQLEKDSKRIIQDARRIEKEWGELL